MVAAVNQFLGAGLYSITEAALYTRVPSARLSRWLFGTQSSDAVLAPQFSPTDDKKRLTFLDLIQTLAIREIRLQKKVPLSKVRQAIGFAKEKYGIDYPFARRHCTYLFGREFVLRLPDRDNEFVEVSGRHRGQRLFEFVELYLQDLTFGPDGLATEYRVFVSRHQTPVAIRMNPHLRFGEPLMPSGYSALALWKAIAIEGNIERAARAYGVSKEEVETAYLFVRDHLGTAV
jgi:hypothetical protein